MADRRIKVRVIPQGVAGLILHGSYHSVQALQVLVNETMLRLQVDCKGAQAYKSGADNHALVHDIQRWLVSLGPDDAEDLKVLQRIAATINQRVGDVL